MAEGATSSSIVLPPQPEWDQGDIIDGAYFAAVDKNLPAVVVSPACDIAQGKIELWTVVALIPDADIAKAILGPELAEIRDPDGTLRPLSKRQRESLGKRLAELINQRLPRYHWLPIEIGSVGAHVADFTHVQSLPADEIQKAQRLGTLASSWREQLPVRYAAYMGRIGTQDLERGFLDGNVARLIEAITGQTLAG